MKKIVLGFALLLALSVSASAQIITGSAASMKLPMPDFLAGPTKTCHARSNGELPDPDCTPGVTNPNITQANINDNICKKANTGKQWTGVNPYTGKPATGTNTLRPPTSYSGKLKALQIKEYGLKKPIGTYEEDHLISLQLGGNPVDPRNLWPEFPKSVNQKDVFEGFLNRQVCSGKITLAQAQHDIATDWKAAWIAAGKPGLQKKKPKAKAKKHH
jgi:hypothetical protein